MGDVSTKTLTLLVVCTIVVALSGGWVILSNVSPELSNSISGMILSNPSGYTTGDVEIEEPELNESEVEETG